MSIGTSGRDVFRNRGTMCAAVPLAVVLTGCLVCLSPHGLGQAAGVNQGGAADIHAPAGLDPLPQHGTSESASQMEQMRQAERHRRVVMDTARLVELSNQLKAEIDQAPKDQLSVNAMRKAVEIEKTAHDVKQWLTY